MSCRTPACPSLLFPRHVCAYDLLLCRFARRTFFALVVFYEFPFLPAIHIILAARCGLLRDVINGVKDAKMGVSHHLYKSNPFGSDAWMGIMI